MTPLKVLYIPTSNAGVSYYRMWSWNVAAHRNRAYLSHMPWFKYDQTENHPWEMDIEDPAHRTRIFNELWDHFRKADVVVMGMVHTPAALDMFLSMKEASAHLGGKVPICVEIDDNMLSTADYNPAAPFYDPGTPFRRLAVEQFKAADAMIVSTNYLKEVYSDLNENISVVHNSLDFKVWDRVQKRGRKGQIRIGWMGGASHNEDLRIIQPVVKNILAKYSNVRFVFVHGIPDFLKGIRGVECVKKFTRIDKYPHFLGSLGFDIGLAPLVDNAFNRGKSNLRWLEYAGMRVPCVASNVGHFAETLVNGKDALLADTPDGFQAALESLITDRAKRRQIGNAAYERARQDFNVDRNVFAYEKILREIVSRGQVKKIETPEYAQQVKTNVQVVEESWDGVIDAVTGKPFVPATEVTQ